ncbi:hypothetical protein FRC03_012862 [Tulasnella sp. 419]|nr:hypothetical protein FRC03_012862 [Tulasnella sp. 419]
MKQAGVLVVRFPQSHSLVVIKIMILLLNTSQATIQHPPLLHIVVMTTWRHSASRSSTQITTKMLSLSVQKLYTANGEWAPLIAALNPPIWALLIKQPNSLQFFHTLILSGGSGMYSTDGCAS